MTSEGIVKVIATEYGMNQIHNGKAHNLGPLGVGASGTGKS